MCQMPKTNNKEIKMKTLPKYFAILITALLITSPLAAQKRMGPDKMRVHEKLNLTEDQQSKIDDLRSEHQKKMIDLRSEMQKSRLALKELRRKGEYNRSEYLEAVEKLNQIRNNIAVSAAEHRMDVYEMLNDEQKEIWNKFDGRRCLRENEPGRHRRMMRNF